MQAEPVRHDQDKAMNLQIERPYIEAMITAFPRLAPLQDQLRFGNKVRKPACFPI
jgi:hypothetical protein